MLGQPINTSPETLKIVSVVCEACDLSKEEFFSSRRTKDLAEARQIAIFLIRKMFYKSYPRIAEELGYKDHTSIIYSDKKITGLLKKNGGLSKLLEALEKLLRSDKRILKREEQAKRARAAMAELQRLRPIKKLPIKEILALGVIENPDFLPKGLDRRSKKILSLFGEGMTLDEVGKKIGVTRERVRQLRERALLAEARREYESSGSQTFDLRGYVSKRRREMELAKATKRRKSWRDKHYEQYAKRSDIQQRVSELNKDY